VNIRPSVSEAHVSSMFCDIPNSSRYSLIVHFKTRGIKKAEADQSLLGL
jgi:hypothetical protein